MNRQEIVRKVDSVLADEFEVSTSEMDPQAELVKDLGLDSLDFVDMVVALKEATGVQLRNDPRVQNIRTLGDLHELVAELVHTESTGDETS